MPDILARPLTLPCRVTLPNRIAKAATTEGLADPAGAPTPALERLYGLWSDGGVLTNRARALLDTMRTVREAVAPDFPVAVKLNSADFQKGGFAFEDSLQVAQWLETAGVDLLEISGATYEQPKLMGIDGIEEKETQRVAQSTLMREAYFVDFALAMQEKMSIPLMVTGGFRRREAMEQAIVAGGADLIGLGRPMWVFTDAPAQLLAGEVELPRHEAMLSVFPPSLAFLTRLKTCALWRALRCSTGTTPSWRRRGTRERVSQACRCLLEHARCWHSKDSGSQRGTDCGSLTEFEIGGRVKVTVTPWLSAS